MTQCDLDFQLQQPIPCMKHCNTPFLPVSLTFLLLFWRRFPYFSNQYSPILHLQTSCLPFPLEPDLVKWPLTLSSPTHDLVHCSPSTFPWQHSELFESRDSDLATFLPTMNTQRFTHSTPMNVNICWRKIHEWILEVKFSLKINNKDTSVSAS